MLFKFISYGFILDIHKTTGALAHGPANMAKRPDMYADRVHYPN